MINISNTIKLTLIFIITIIIVTMTSAITITITTALVFGAMRVSVGTGLPKLVQEFSHVMVYCEFGIFRNNLIVVFICALSIAADCPERDEVVSP